MKRFLIGKRAIPEFWKDMERAIMAHGAYVRADPGSVYIFAEEFVLMTKEEVMSLIHSPRRVGKEAEEAYKSLVNPV